MDGQKNTGLEAILAQLIEHGADDMANIFARAFDLAMGPSANAFSARAITSARPAAGAMPTAPSAGRIDTPAGTVTVQVLKSAGHDGEPFYPQSLERGRRSVRAVMLAVAEMYIKGVSTREAEAVMRQFGIESLSSSQVSRATRLLDEELEAWRNRGPSGRSAISSSMRATKRCASVGWSVMPPCFRPSASVRTRAAGCWASRWPCRRPRSTGGRSWKACRRAGCAGWNMSSPTTTAACAPPEGPCSAAPNGSHALKQRKR